MMLLWQGLFWSLWCMLWLTAWTSHNGLPLRASCLQCNQGKWLPLQQNEQEDWGSTGDGDETAARERRRQRARAVAESLEPAAAPTRRAQDPNLKRSSPCPFGFATPVWVDDSALLSPRQSVSIAQFVADTLRPAVGPGIGRGLCVWQQTWVAPVFFRPAEDAS